MMQEYQKRTSQKALIILISSSLICTLLMPYQAGGINFAYGNVKGTETLSNWSEDVRLTYTSKNNTEVEIASNGDYIHVVWFNLTDYQAHYIRGENHGKIWGNSIQLSHDTPIILYPDIAVNGSNVYVVWEDWRNGREVYYKVSHDNGQTWSDDIPLTSNDGYYSQHPTIAVNGSNIHVVWEDERNGDNYFELFYKRSIDGGITWDDGKGNTNLDRQLTVCPPPDADCLPDIAVDGDYIYLVWSKYIQSTSAFEIYYMYSWDNGGNWSSPQIISSDDYADSSGAKIAINGSSIHVVWREEKDGNMETYYRSSTDNGDHWDPEIRLTYTSVDEYDPHIAVDGNNIYVTYGGNETGGWLGYLITSYDGGITWGNPIVLCENNSGVGSLTIQNGYVHCAFVSKRTGNGEIWYKRKPSFNDPPIINYLYPLGNLTITENQNITFMINATDSDNGTLYYQWYANDVSVGKNNSTYTFYANSTCSGTFEIKIVVSDNISSPVNHTWTITVINVGELYNNITNLQNQINALQLNITTLLTQLNEVLGNNTALQSIIFNLTENLTLAEEQISTLWELLNLSKQNETILQGVINNLTDNLTIAQGLVSMYWDLWNLSKVNETILQGVIDNLTGDLNSAQEMVSTYWALWNLSKQNETQLQSYIDNLTQNLTSVENQLDLSKQNETSLVTQMDELENENIRLRNELNETKKTPMLSGTEIIIILVSLCVIMMIVKKKQKQKEV